MTIQLRGDTAANWTSANPVLANRQVGLETDTRKMKVGDGSTAWNSLSYWFAGGSGTVTSVAASGGTTGLSFTGSPITTSGTLTLSGTLGVANGGTGATTLTGYVKGSGTSAFTAAATIPASDLSGTLAAGQFPALTGDVTTSAGSLATTIGAGTVTLAKMANLAANSILGNNTGSSATPIALTAAQVRTLINVADGATANLGTVTSVSGTGTVSGLTLTGTVTGSGSLTLGGTLTVAASNFASQTANTFLAAPNGAAGVPTFRAIVAADIPTLNQNTTGSAATLTTSRNFSISGGGITAAAVGFDGSAAVTLSASVDAGHITLARMANLAANSFIGNNTGSAATPLALNGTQATALLDVATGSLKGLMSAADKSKLDGVASGATANSSDAVLFNRANHTGTQAASTISDFNSTARAQVEAMLIAGTNTTITGSGSGATRQLTIASTGGGGGGLSIGLASALAAGAYSM